jgi:hypothetical protein
MFLCSSLSFASVNEKHHDKDKNKWHHEDKDRDRDKDKATPIPEPGTFALMFVGLLGVVVIRTKKK